MSQLLAVSPSAISSPASGLDNYAAPRLEQPLLMQPRAEQAARLGLPPIGSQLSSSDGMQWMVIDHMHAPNLVSYARNRGLSSSPNSDDLVPRVAAEHLSPRLLNFWIETDRCTSKAFLIVDTLPHLRPQYAFRHGHSVDAWSVPDATLFAFDFANIHESIIAHEIAHVWIDLVEDCEDYRSPVDWLNTARAQQILFIQSFVLDRKVNQVIAERGFDLSIFAEHSRQSISNFTKAILLGHRPPTQREAVLNALMIASALLEQEDGLYGKEAAETQATVLCYDGSIASALRLLRAEVPEIYDLAECFVASVQKHGTNNREQIRHAIDECLTVAFEFSGDPLDLETELCEDAPNETYQLDKTPDFLPDWPVRAKIEANKICAKLRVGNEAPYRLSQSFSGAAQIEFLHPCGVWTSPVIVPHAPYVPQLPAPQEALPPGLRHLSPAVLNLLPETMRAQQPSKTGVHAAQIPMPTVITPQVPQMPVIPSLPDMSASWFGASSKPTYGRSYMAGVGLWLSEARLAEQLCAREHSYGYAFNNPISYADPDGDRPLKPNPYRPDPDWGYHPAPPPHQPARPVRPVRGVCGPDVSQQLNNAIESAKNTFHGLSFLDKGAACNLLINVPHCIDSWDIKEFKEWRWKIQQAAPNCGRGSSACAGTVMVAGTCHSMSALNFLLFGVYMRLCNDQFPVSIPMLGTPFSINPFGLTNTIAMAGGWKILAYQNTETAEQASRWAAQGWQGEGIYGLSTPNRQSGCTRCRTPFTMKLTPEWTSAF